MNKFYFTVDFDVADNCIKVDADIDIFKASSFKEFEVKISNLFDCDGVVEGVYGDCWMKLMRCPDSDDEFDGIHIDDISVLYPCTHPGGNVFWLTPKDPVYVLKFKDSKEG